jgi:hypothetical protein
MAGQGRRVNGRADEEERYRYLEAPRSLKMTTTRYVLWPNSEAEPVEVVGHAEVQLEVVAQDDVVKQVAKHTVTAAWALLLQAVQQRSQRRVILQAVLWQRAAFQSFRPGLTDSTSVELGWQWTWVVAVVELLLQGWNRCCCSSGVAAPAVQGGPQPDGEQAVFL